MAPNVAGGIGTFAHRYRAISAFLMIGAAFAIAHGPRVKANYREFQWEDREFIQHNARAIQSLWNCFSKSSVWPGLYRPLTTNLYYFVGRQFFSNQIEVHHLINVAMYLANGFVLYLICLNLFPHPWAFLPPIIFVSRVSHVEVISNTCEFQSLLSIFFTLLALHLFIASQTRAKRLLEMLSIVAFGLALLSKETAVVFLFLLPAYGWLFDRQFSWRRYLAPILASALSTMLFVVLLRHVVGHNRPPLAFDASLSNVVRNYSTYLLAFSNLLTYKLQSIVMVPLVANLASTRLAQLCLSVLAGTSAVFFLIHHRLRGAYIAPARTFVFGILVFVIGAAPYVILSGRLFMRYSYFGHAGLAISSGVVLREVASSIFRRMS
jgi:hypothetical protein